MLKKILAIACTIFMLGSISAFALEPTPVPTPVVRNGGFESAYSSMDWAGVGVTLKEANLVTTHKHSGEKSLRLPGADGKTTVAKQLNVQFNFVAGTPYILSVWYYNPKEVADQSAKGNVVVYDGVKNLVNTALAADTASTAWVLKYFEFTPTTNLSSIEIWLCNYSTKADVPIYYDDISLMEKPAVMNGDFEAAEWGKTVSPSNGSTATRVNNGAVSGDFCMEIVGGKDANNPSIYKDGVRLKTNTEYELSFYFKANSTVGYPRARIGNFWYYDTGSREWCFSEFENAANNKPAVAANTWVKCTYNFKTGDTIPARNNVTYISLYGLKGITCYYDKVELVEATNKIMLHDMEGTYGKDVTSLSDDTTYYAKGRFIPAGDSTSAVLIVAVFDESTGTKQLQDVQVAPYTGTNGAAQTLETEITVENSATSSVEVYMWDSLSGMSRYLKKLRVPATE